MSVEKKDDICNQLLAARETAWANARATTNALAPMFYTESDTYADLPRVLLSIGFIFQFCTELGNTDIDPLLTNKLGQLICNTVHRVARCVEEQDQYLKLIHRLSNE